MRPQDEPQQRTASGQQKQKQERDPRVSQSEGPGEGDSSATRRERRPEIPPAAQPAKTDDEARDAGVVEEVVKSDQVDG